MNRLYLLAEQVGSDKAALKKELLEARSNLKELYRDKFKRFNFDQESKSLIGDGVRLRWVNNGRTNCGVVILERI